jgi:PAS domain S-box-containing protein
VIHEERGHLRTVVDAAPVPMLISRASDGLILHANALVAEALGLPGKSIIGRRTADFYEVAERSAILERIENDRGLEVRARRADGTHWWVIVSIERSVFEGEAALVAAFQDITERKLTEEALRESEARLRAFASAVPDIAFILDENGLYVEVLAMPETEDLLYASADAVRGRRLHDVLPKRSADRFLSIVTKTIETQEPQVLEYVLNVPAGRRWFEGRTAPLPPAGDNRMVVWVSRDITERKQAEATNLKAREELDGKVERAVRRGNSYDLSFRELTVLELVSTGKSDRDIATVLGIRLRTVNKHVENIRRKMNAASRMEAGLRAIREGVLGQE